MTQTPAPSDAPASAAKPEARAAKPEARGGTAPSAKDEVLKTERGQTTIADAVVTKVASVATREVRGVHTLGGDVTRAIGTVTQAMGVGDERTEGVSVEVGEKEAAIDLTIIVEYGESIPRVAQAVRDNVIKRIEGITGLQVTEVNVDVHDIHFPGDDEPDQSARVS